MSAAVTLTGATVLRNGRKILDGLSLDLHHGELLALVGPNGSGKSTALRVMAGVLRPDAGTLLYDGQPAPALDRLERARFAAYLPQDFRPHWDITVRELIALGTTRGRPLGWTASRPAPTAPDDRLGLQPLLARRLSTLSGGERARAAFAAATVGAPQVLLADEPVASLDIPHQHRLLQAVRGTLASVAALVVLHDLNLAARFADRIAVIGAGRCIAIGPPAEVLASGHIDEVFETRFTRLQVDGRLVLTPE